MTEKQFFTSKWKPFEIMTVYIKELDRNLECYLLGIDFENRIMEVRPFDDDMCEYGIYEDDIYKVPIDITKRGKDKSKLRIV